jgi:hypothetical protein
MLERRNLASKSTGTCIRRLGLPNPVSKSDLKTIRESAGTLHCTVERGLGRSKAYAQATRGGVTPNMDYDLPKIEVSLT